MNSIAEPKDLVRYNSIQVFLHWLSALLLIIMLFMGTFILQNLPNDVEKAEPIKVHMIVGGVIALIMLFRLIMKWMTAQPIHKTTGNQFIDFSAKAAHTLLYVLVFAMWGSGVALAITANIPDVVFDGIGTLPADFDSFPARHLHGLLGILLSFLVILHVIGSLYHHFILKDNLFTLMWFK